MASTQKQKTASEGSVAGLLSERIRGLCASVACSSAGTRNRTTLSASCISRVGRSRSAQPEYLDKLPTRSVANDRHIAVGQAFPCARWRLN